MMLSDAGKYLAEEGPARMLQRQGTECALAQSRRVAVYRIQLVKQLSGPLAYRSRLLVM